jgi:uncharacterized membrane protein
MSYNIFKPRPEKVFAFIGIAFGLAFLFLSPPLKAHDEWNHFYRAYKISEGDFIAEKRSSRLVGAEIPLDVMMAVRSLRYDIPLNADSRFVILFAEPKTRAVFYPFTEEKRKRRKEVIFSLLGQPAEARAEGLHPFASFPNTALYPPLPYVPQATGIALGRALGLPPIMLMYAGRLLNLACWLFLVYAAIKSTPVLKWGFLLLALTPMNLYIASSLSADSLTIGMAFLLTALFLSHAYSEKETLGRQDLFLIFVLSIAVSLTKSYFLLPLLYLVLPPSLFSSKKKYVLFLVLIYTLVITSMASWAYLVKDLNVPVVPGVSAKKQLRLIVGNPLWFLGIVLDTAGASGMHYARSFLGHLGHYGNLFLPPALMVIHAVMLVFVSLVDSPGNFSIRVKDKFIFLGIFVLSIAVIFAAMYVYSTSLEKPFVDGVQGRYFLPIAPLLLLLLSNRRTTLPRSSPWLPGAVLSYAVVSLSVTLYVLVSAYYA